MALTPISEFYLRNNFGSVTQFIVMNHGNPPPQKKQTTCFGCKINEMYVTHKLEWILTTARAIKR